MPWTGAFRKRNRGLSAGEAGKAAKQANAVLKSTGDEGLAIAVANKHAKGFAEGGQVQTEDQRDKALLDYKPGLQRQLPAGIRAKESQEASDKFKVDEHARGGKITEVAGKPIGKDDGLIAAQRGEFVVKKSAAKKLGLDVLNEINKGRLPNSERLYGRKAVVRHG